MTVEMRLAEVDGMQIRAVGDGDKKQEYVEGLGVVYGREVEIFEGYFEQIRAGAFNKCFHDNAEIKSFFNHDPDNVLATTRSTPKLELVDTNDGLSFKAPIPDTTYGRDLAENLKRGNVRGASFAFTINDGGATWTEDERGMHREITSATIYEVGPVTNPAYPQTTAKVRNRSLDDIKKEAEEYLDAVKKVVGETKNEYRGLPLFDSAQNEAAATAPEAPPPVENVPVVEVDKRAININDVWSWAKRKQLDLLERGL
jgi:uncharacterized protein